MTDAAPPRHLVRVDFDYALCGPGGSRTPNTHSKSWFFEAPAARDTAELWDELLNRIVYDTNVRLRRREPNDANWLGVVALRRSEVDVAAMLASDDHSFDALPWFVADRNVVWEAGACYTVDDGGRYDVMTAGDYTELILWRQLNAGRIERDAFIDFFDHLLALSNKPPMGQRIYDAGQVRLANLVEVRATTNYRKPPGERPWTSGPVDDRLVTARA
jgi:hypothetical protein